MGLIESKQPCEAREALGVKRHRACGGDRGMTCQSGVCVEREHRQDPATIGKPRNHGPTK